MKPINEVTLKKQILSTNSPPSDEIAFLHALLNHHLGPPDDQLPTEGKPGGRNFGPRTKAKVQKFQDVNKIDFGTKFFKDGVVGPHTGKASRKTASHYYDYRHTAKAPNIAGSALASSAFAAPFSGADAAPYSSAEVDAQLSGAGR